MLMPVIQGNFVQHQNELWVGGSMGIRVPGATFGPGPVPGLPGTKRHFPNFQLNPAVIPQFPRFFPPYLNCSPIPPSPPTQNSVYSPLKNPKMSPRTTQPNPAKNLESKKTRIFRPWDDDSVSESKEGPAKSSPTPTVTLSETSGGKSRRNSTVISVQDSQQSALETIATNLGKSSEGHRCIYCGKVYSRKYGLKIHLRTHTGFKPLKCKVCHRAFGDPSNLNKHTRLHAENGLAFKCHFCGKLLIRRRDLDRHLISRHNFGVTEQPARRENGILNSVDTKKENRGHEDIISGQTVISESEVGEEDDEDESVVDVSEL